MVDSNSSELFRYVRVRGLRAESTQSAVIVSPPPNLSYKILRKVTAKPLDYIGLPTDLKSLPTLLAAPKGLANLVALGRLISVSTSTPEAINSLVAQAPQFSELEVAWLWDSLGLALLDTKSHPDVSWIKSAIRAICLIDKFHEAGGHDVSQPTIDSARSLVFHLPSSPLPIDTQPTTQPTINPKPTANQGVLQLRQKISVLSQALEELQQTPKVIIEVPIPAGASLQSATTASATAKVSQTSAATKEMTTKRSVVFDLSGLSNETLTVLGEFGGTAKSVDNLIKSTQKKIANLTNELLASGSPSYKISVANGVNGGDKLCHVAA
jgi:hypothetical protein